MREYPGFVFWGLFLVFGLIVVLYYFWMRKENRREEGERESVRRRDFEQGDPPSRKATADGE